MLLFSYGSNDPAQLEERLGHRVSGMRAAYLRGYVRVFRGWSRNWGGGTASIEPQAGGVVYGYVAPVVEEDLRELDRYEGVARDKYRRHIVRTDQGDAVAYVATSKTFAPPSPAYLKAVARTIGSFWRGKGDAPVQPSDITIRENPLPGGDLAVLLGLGVLVFAGLGYALYRA